MDAAVALPTASFSTSQIFVATQYARQFIDLTAVITEHVTASRVSSGLLVVASRHTTASLVVNEHEPELLRDMDAFLGFLAPEDGLYAHNQVPCGPDEHPNGHAHCQALLLNASVSLPIVGGHARLGRYQRIFLVELDHARQRTVQVLVMGSSA